MPPLVSSTGHAASRSCQATTNSRLVSIFQTAVVLNRRFVWKQRKANSCRVSRGLVPFLSIIALLNLTTLSRYPINCVGDHDYEQVIVNEITAGSLIIRTLINPLQTPLMDQAWLSQSHSSVISLLFYLPTAALQVYSVTCLRVLITFVTCSAPSSLLGVGQHACIQYVHSHGRMVGNCQNVSSWIHYNHWDFSY